MSALAQRRARMKARVLQLNGKVKLLIKGVGTPQIGAGASSTEKSIDRVTRLYDDAKNNPYGSD